MVATACNPASFFSTGGGSRVFGIGNEGFSSPWLDQATMAMPDDNRNALEWCFVPGTPIELADFTVKPIEKMRRGHDFVLTRGRTHERVVETSVRMVDETIVRLTFAGLGTKLPLQMTQQHKVWRIRTANLKPSRVADSISIGNAEKVPAKNVRAGDYFATPLPLRGDVKQHRFSGWLTGMYAAEGCPICVDGRYLAARFTLGADDEETGVLAELIRRASEETGYPQTGYVPPSRPDTRLVTVSDVELPDWLQEHIPGDAKTKQFTGKILEYSDEFLFGVIGGFIDGDGNVSSVRGSFNGALATSASYAMLYQLQRISYCLGLTPSLCQVKSDRGFAPEGSVCYALSFGKHDCQALKGYSIKLRNAAASYADFEPKAKGRHNDVFVRDGHVFHRVRQATTVDYEGPVYNFEVENDHSYVAGGILVANCEYIWQQNGTYRQAQDRKISYFLTDIDVGARDADKQLGDDEKEKWTTFLEETLGILDIIKEMDLNRETYGNAFASMIVPFRRLLVCPTCYSQFPLREVMDNGVFKFKWDNFEFKALCPQCSFRGTWIVNDQPDDLEKRLKIKIWSPKEIEIINDLYTGDCAYVWRIPEDYKRQIRSGRPYYLERVSLQVLKAIKNNQLFQFNPEVLFHMKEPTLAGIRNHGWGISRILTLFRDIWHVQVLRRYNESIALDYVIPFRLITPEARSGGGGSALAEGAMTDPLQSMNMGNFRSQVMRMIRQRRRDPASWHTLPFPVKYQALGGDANALATPDLLNQAVETMLNASGTPMELYRGTMQLQAAPVSLRLFEATNYHLVHDNNCFLRWAVNQISQILSWEMVTARMRRVTHADDFNKQMAQLQLMMGQAISQGTGLRAIGLDWEDEQRRIAEEARRQAELQARVQEEMEQDAFGEQIAKGQMPGMAGPGGGAMPPGAAPAAGAAAGDPAAQAAGPVTGMIQSGSVPQSLDDLMAQADSLAQELLMLPESQKDSELRALSQKNEALHSMVKTKIEKLRQKARTAGGAMLLGQQGAAPQ